MQSTDFPTKNKTGDKGGKLYGKPRLFVKVIIRFSVIVVARGGAVG